MSEARGVRTRELIMPIDRAPLAVAAERRQVTAIHLEEALISCDAEAGRLRCPAAPFSSAGHELSHQVQLSHQVGGPRHAQMHAASSRALPLRSRSGSF